MRRSLPNDDDEETMRPAKLLFYALFILALGIYASHALFDGIARTQEARERAKLDKVRAGESTRIAGYEWMKISEVKAEAGNVR